MRISAVLVVFVFGCGGQQPADDTLASRGDVETADTVARSDTEGPESPAPGQPVFAIGVWPGEGIPVIEAARSPVLLHATPSASARVTDTLVLSGSKGLTYDSTRVQTLAPASLDVVAPIVVSGRFFGPTRFLSREAYYSASARDTSIELSRGDTLAHLQDRAEGSCLISLSGNVIEAGTCPTFDTTGVRRSGKPLTAWWIHVNMNGRRGWALVSDSTARVTRRTF